MSFNVSESYYAALSGQITYVNDLVAADGTGKVGQELVQAILATTDSTGITEAQAIYFAENFRVVAQQPTTGHGFSATVFEYIETGKLYFAMRGTDEELPGTLQAIEESIDWVEANALGLFTQGVASYQAIDMVNFYLQLTTATGETPVQYQLVPFTSDEQDAFLSVTPVFEVLPNIYAQLVQVPAEQVEVEGLGMALNQAVITGHSLGGHGFYNRAFQQLSACFAA